MNAFTPIMEYPVSTDVSPPQKIGKWSGWQYLPLFMGVGFILLSMGEFGQALEIRSLVVRQQLFSKAPPSSSVTLVVTRPPGLSPPDEAFRESIAAALSTLTKASPDHRPSVILVDGTLANRPYNEGFESDLSVDIAKLGRVVTSFQFTRSAQGEKGDPLGYQPSSVWKHISKHGLSNASGVVTLQDFDGLRLFHPSFSPEIYAASIGMGFTNMSTALHEGDGLYRLPLTVKCVPTLGMHGCGDLEGNPVFPSLALAGAIQVLCGEGMAENCLRGGEYLFSKSLSIGSQSSLPLDHNGMAWIRFRERFQLPVKSPDIVAPCTPGALEALPTLTPPGDVVYFLRCGPGNGVFIDPISGKALLPTAFAQQALLVVDGQERTTLSHPFSADRRSLQSSIHAQLLANFMDGDLLRPIHPYLGHVLALLGLLMAYFLDKTLRLKVSNISSSELEGRWALLGFYGKLFLRRVELPLVALWVLIAGVSFWQWNLVLPIVSPLGALLGAALAGVAILPLRLEDLSRRSHVLLLERDETAKELRNKVATLGEMHLQLVELNQNIHDRNEGERTLLEGAQVDDSALFELENFLDSIEKTMKSNGVQVKGGGLDIDVNRAEVSVETVDALRSNVKVLRDKMSALNAELSSEATSLPLIRQWLELRSRASQHMFEAAKEALQQSSAMTARLKPVESGTPAYHLHGEHVKSAKKLGILTQHPPLLKLLDSIAKRYAPHDESVLILGESGTGKELVAQGLYRLSKRAKGPWVVINCAAIPANLIDAELFGHVKGAFTGASQSRPGRIREAHRGALFLDEVDRLSQKAQETLLRVLQTREVVPVGGELSDRVVVDVRFIAAAKATLPKAVQEGSFTLDLYHRLLVIPIKLPPLRERGSEDIALLAQHFLGKACQSQGRQFSLSAGALDLLLRYKWPGNIRELEHLIKFLAIETEGELIPEALVKSALETRADMQALEDTTKTKETELSMPVSEDVFSDRDQQLLDIQRRHDFNGKRCANDPDYPSSTPQSATRHFRVLASKALAASNWDAHGAADILAGSNVAAKANARSKVQSFLEKMSKRMKKEEPSSLDASINKQYRADAVHIIALIQALYTAP